MGGQRWTADEDAILRREYPIRRTEDVCALLTNRNIGSVYYRAYRELGLRKSPEFFADVSSGRIQRGQRLNPDGMFRKGQAPANKGLRRPGWGTERMKATQFKKGERHGVACERYVPIGTERVSEDGYRKRKISDGRPFNRRWRFVHLLVWEAAHGPVPKGHAVTFVNGNKQDVRLENLQLVTRAELMRRNTIHNYPAPIPQLVQLRGALTRKIRRAEEQSA